MTDHALPEHAAAGHADWLRRLALSLVRDPSQADDLVQEAWLEAIRRPPEPSRPHAWLATVVRNAARRLGCREDARRARERVAAKLEAAANGSLVLERARLQRELSGRVLALREPYRTTLLLRFFEDLPPREIARRTGRPVHTVRTHVERGLAVLREQLDGEYGDREAWSLALLPLAAALGSGARRAAPWLAGSGAVVLGTAVVALGCLLPGDDEGVSPIAPDSDTEAAERATRANQESEEADGTATPDEWGRRSVVGPPPPAAAGGDEVASPRVPSAMPLAPAAPGAIVRPPGIVPPGSVFLEARRVRVGLDEDVAKHTIEGAGGRNSVIWGETPEHEVRVEDFWLMTTEVTNEQFAEFVVATGAKPPEPWGRAAIDRAQVAFLEEQGARIAAARANGTEWPPRQKFQRDAWWAENWRTASWEVPAGSDALPVVYVDVASAHAYARWAGMRLPSEEEFQRAARGDTRRLYPWGEAWDPARVVSIETSGDGPRPVGSRPAGASPEGVLDLAGNVWEWTSSPYAPYAKHRADRLRLTGNGAVRFVELVGEWDPDRRVSVGGSYLNGALGLRATTRRSVERYWTLEALGFRSAASPRAGLDVATAVVRDDLPRSIRSEHDFDLDGLVAIDRWRSRAGTVSLSPPSTSEHADVRLGPYAVVTAYDWLLFVPVADVDDSMLAVMRKRSAAEEPLVLGVLSTSLALASPAVGAGTWIVRWRCEDGTGPARLELSDLAGGRVAAIEHDGPREERMREGSIATEDDGTVRVDAVIRVARNRALTLDLVLRLAPEDRARLAGDWRR